MTTATLSPATPLTSTTLAELAVAAIRAEADLTPKPGLVDQRGSGAHTDMDLAMLYESADSLHIAFSECGSAATQSVPGPKFRARRGGTRRAGDAATRAASATAERLPVVSMGSASPHTR